MNNVALIICWDGIQYFREINDDEYEIISEYYRNIPIINFSLMTNINYGIIDNYIKEMRLKKLKTINNE